MKKLIVILLLAATVPAVAQELQAKLTVVANRVSSQVDKKVFQTLQTNLSNFLNARKWTTQTYLPHEKIKCNFLVNIDQVLDQPKGIYKATLTIQASRPVYNTTYESPTINFQDNDFVFKYVEFQPIEFNENRVQGNDPLSANITAMLVYYGNLILGIDYDSFSPRGGDPFFQKAFNIVNNAPEGRDISGWKAFDGQRNRFRLIQNLTDNRFALLHDVIYTYYRTGLDQFYADEAAGRTGVLNALNMLTAFNKDNPNTMYLPVFFQGKSNELARIFSKADPEIKSRAREMLLKLDITNTQVYKDLR